jgi:hypothetical protein
LKSSNPSTSERGTEKGIFSRAFGHSSPPLIA